MKSLKSAVATLALLSFLLIGSSSTQAVTETPIPSPTAEPTSTPTETATAKPAPRKVSKFNPKVPYFQQANFSKAFSEYSFSYKQADSIWVLVNKARPLNPADYEPEIVIPRFAKPGFSNPKNQKLRSDAANALVQMDRAFNKQTGKRIILTSGYRSYSAQKAIHSLMVKRYGSAGGDRIAARPGFSEHQTGIAVDLGTTGGTNYKWLAANAWKYGYILRYPNKKTKVTGYQYEPWHFRYIGELLATEYHYLGATSYEEFLTAGSAPKYDIQAKDPDFFK